MHTLLPSTLTILLAALTTASPLVDRSATAGTCPPVFSLVISTPGHNYTGATLGQDAGIGYFFKTAPTGNDTVAHFYQNDTTHLYATGFDTFYPYGHGITFTQTPPYMFGAFDSGYAEYKAASAGKQASFEAVQAFVSSDDETQELDFVAQDGGVGGFWICGGETGNTGLANLGAVNFTNSRGACDRVTLKKVPVPVGDLTEKDVC